MVRLVEGQHVVDCYVCKTRYYSPLETPPALVLKPRLGRDQARDQVMQAFKHDEIAAHFRHHADFIDAHCYYVPIFEVRILRAGWQEQAFSGETIFNYHPEVRMAVANDLADLDLDTIDCSPLQEELLTAASISFDPLSLRQSGTILPFTEFKLISESDAILDPDILEKYYRLIYLPIWQVSFQYRGLIYKSYISAVGGQILSLKALREYKKKLLYSLLGLLSTVVFIGRGPVEGPVFALLSVGIGIPMLIFLVPYLWEMYAYREMVQVEGQKVTKQPMSMVERSFVETGKLFFKNLFGRRRKGRR